jgi:hypothetical protein
VRATPGNASGRRTERTVAASWSVSPAAAATRRGERIQLLTRDDAPVALLCQGCVASDLSRESGSSTSTNSSVDSRCPSFGSGSSSRDHHRRASKLAEAGGGSSEKRQPSSGKSNGATNGSSGAQKRSKSEEKSQRLASDHAVKQQQQQAEQQITLPGQPDQSFCFGQVQSSAVYSADHPASRMYSDTSNSDTSYNAAVASKTRTHASGCPRIAEGDSGSNSQHDEPLPAAPIARAHAREQERRRREEYNERAAKALLGLVDGSAPPSQAAQPATTAFRQPQASDSNASTPPAVPAGVQAVHEHSALCMMMESSRPDSVCAAPFMPGYKLISAPPIMPRSGAMSPSAFALASEESATGTLQYAAIPAPRVAPMSPSTFALGLGDTSMRFRPAAVDMNPLSPALTHRHDPDADVSPPSGPPGEDTPRSGQWLDEREQAQALAVLKANFEQYIHEQRHQRAMHMQATLQAQQLLPNTSSSSSGGFLHHDPPLRRPFPASSPPPPPHPSHHVRSESTLSRQPEAGGEPGTMAPGVLYPPGGDPIGQSSGPIELMSTYPLNPPPSAVD